MVELKRSRSWREGKAAAAAELESVESMAMANCMSILSRLDDNRIPLMSGDKEFECKTCRKRFHSFQALGGHRASHKKPRVYGDGVGEDGRSKKLHLCSVCGMEFDKGQSLGGHMSKHRAKQPPPPRQHQFVLVPAASHENVDVNNRSGDSGGGALTMTNQGEAEAESSSASAAAVGWDLNLTPFQNERMVTGLPDGLPRD